MTGVTTCGADDTGWFYIDYDQPTLADLLGGTATLADLLAMLVAHTLCGDGERRVKRSVAWLQDDSPAGRKHCKRMQETMWVLSAEAAGQEPLPLTLWGDALDEVQRRSPASLDREAVTRCVEWCFQNGPLVRPLGAMRSIHAVMLSGLSNLPEPPLEQRADEAAAMPPMPRVEDDEENAATAALLASLDGGRSAVASSLLRLHPHAAWLLEPAAAGLAEPPKFGGREAAMLQALRERGPLADDAAIAKASGYRNCPSFRTARKAMCKTGYIAADGMNCVGNLHGPYCITTAGERALDEHPRL